MATSQDQSLGSSSDENGQLRFREKLLAVDLELKVQDVESLKFLCIGFISQNKMEKSSSALDLFDHLIARELLSVKDSFFLAELLYTIKQNYLLQHLGYTQKQVERLLPTQRKLSPFRKLLYELSEGIGEDNLKDIIFLLADKIPKIPMTSLSLLAYLEKITEIDEDNLILLEEVFKKVAPRLIRKIENYKREKAAQEATPPVDKETNSLHQGEEEIFSPSDIKQFHGALPANGANLGFQKNKSIICYCNICQELLWQNEQSRNHGNGTVNGAPVPVSMEMLGASANTLSSETWTKETIMYRMDRKHRGHCVIINNHSFTSLKDRPGTHRDAECLKLVFEWLGFTARKYDDVTKGVMEKILQEYKSHPGHTDGDCFVFCILTHGEFGAVYSSDGVLIPIREIMHHFTAQQCPGLAHKPKLFFIQACQGAEVQSSVFTEADAQNSEHLSLKDSIPVEADFLLGLATVPGYMSFRHVKNGSWYIQSLCSNLKNLVPRQEDILSILTAVNNDVSQQMNRDGTWRQMPQPAFTLRRKLVFPVPQHTLLSL